MNAWLLFSPSTGQGVQTIKCPKHDAQEMAIRMGLGIIAISGETDATHYVDVSSSALVAKPAQPGRHHTFNWQTKQWVAAPEAAWASVKQRRSRLLADSDWIVTKASESGQPVHSDWTTYRQALRDITLQTDPWSIVWPVSP